MHIVLSYKSRLYYTQYILDIENYYISYIHIYMNMLHKYIYKVHISYKLFITRAAHAIFQIAFPLSAPPPY